MASIAVWACRSEHDITFAQDARTDFYPLFPQPMTQTKHRSTATRRCVASRILGGRQVLALLALGAAVCLIQDDACAAIGPFGAAQGLQPNTSESILRPMRYQPEGVDFVIVNGQEYFNRPLYGGNTAFRVDGGDRPECVLYLPGRGGNLRMGVRTSSGNLWLHEAAHIEFRYRPGSLRYEIEDPRLGTGGRISMAILALAETEGVLVRIEARNVPADLEWIWAYGGMNGQRGARDGDIGTERVPISQWFQLQPEFCRGNKAAIGDADFKLHGRPATIHGIAPEGTRLSLAHAGDWGRLEALCAMDDGSTADARTPEFPIVVGRRSLKEGETLLLALQRLPAEQATESSAKDATSPEKASAAVRKREPAPSLPLRQAYSRSELPGLWQRTEAHFEGLRRQLEVMTPDPHFNAAVAALNVAADAVWDEPQGVVMHGAIAWRSKLLGWRGPYAMDALGWHERARRHLAYWATRQNTTPVPDRLPPADVSANFARSEAALHSNGDMSNSHYDMNLVYIDALFRHLRWTGDLAFAREVWPVIERHLAWERRLFRREYGPDRQPLYEAYAAIWASDDLQYHGGGTTHTTAYNFFHNKEAARLAALLGFDGGRYEEEAAAIGRAMRRWLWIQDGGGFGEYRDFLGLQKLHENAGLWTFYHTMDSEVPTPTEAAAMVRKLSNDMPRIPVRGPSVPEGLHMLPTTTWMPYTWSLNNVVMGENVHTAIGLWLAGESTEAWMLLRGSVIASMYMGICPGNVGSMNYLDVHRRESQRDFADGGGVLSRAVVEGVFGIRPDMLAGEITFSPGWPDEWQSASLRHARVGVVHKRIGEMDTYRLETRLGRPVKLRFEPPAALGASVEVRVNGRPIEPQWAEGAQRKGRPQFLFPASEAFEIQLFRKQGAVAKRSSRKQEASGVVSRKMQEKTTTADGLREIGWWRCFYSAVRMHPVPLDGHFNDRVTAIFAKGKYLSPRSPFCSLAIPSQGIGAWAGHVNAMAEVDDSGLRKAAAIGGGVVTLPNGLVLKTPGEAATPNVLFVSQWDNYPKEAVVPLEGRAEAIVLLMAGSTNAMQSRFDNGEVEVRYSDGTCATLSLRNPTNWWPIDQDYFVDDYAFARPGPFPPRLDLRTGVLRLLEQHSFKGRGGSVPGGAATLLVLPLDRGRELRSLSVRALANEVVIGLMAATLLR